MSGRNLKLRSGPALCAQRRAVFRVGVLKNRRSAKVGDPANDMKIVKLEVLGKMIAYGLVAVIRAESDDQAERVAEACIQGGVGAVEITYTVPQATSVIEHLAKKLSGNILLGAGTGLDPRTRALAFWP